MADELAPWLTPPSAPPDAANPAPQGEVAPWLASKPQEPDVAEDVVKSAGVGVGKGLVGIAGLPGDVAEYGARGIDYLAQKLPEGIRPAPRAAQEPTYGSADIQSGIEKNVTGKFYDPKTNAGKYAQTVGEFIPAVIGGPETLAARIMTRAAVPGVLSETAGQVAHEVAPAAEPYVRTGVGIAAGMRGSTSKYAVPTFKDLEREKTRLYASPEIAAVRIDPGAVNREIGTIRADIEKTLDPDLTKRTVGLLKHEEAQYAASQPGAMSALTKTQPAAKADVTINDLDTLRKQLRLVARNYNPDAAHDAAAASIAMGKIDDFLANLKQPDLVAGNAAKAVPLLGEARDTFAAMRRVESADKKIASAILRAGSTNSGQNVENAIRQNLRRIIDPDSRAAAKLRSGWSQLEIDRATDIVKGGHISDSIRFAGNKLSGTHGFYGGGLLALEEAYRGNFGRALALGAAVPAAGMALKGIGNLRAHNKARDLSELLASRSPLAQKWRRQGRKVPASPAETISGLGTYSLPAVTNERGFKAGGRVTRSFRYKP